MDKIKKKTDNFYLQKLEGKKFLLMQVSIINVASSKDMPLLLIFFFTSSLPRKSNS